jgi:hypothetical protein
MKNGNQRTGKNQENQKNQNQEVPEPPQKQNDRNTVSWAATQVVTPWARTRAMYRICGRRPRTPEMRMEKGRNENILDTGRLPNP